MLFEKKEYKERLKKVKDLMQKQGIELLVSHDPANMNYLTGYDAWSFYVPQCVVISLDENEPYWIGRGIDAPSVPMTTYLKPENVYSYLDTYVHTDDCHPMDFIAQTMDMLGFGNKVIGVEMDSFYFTASCYQLMCRHLPNATIKDAGVLVNWLRAIKSEKEVELMRQAGQIMDIVMGNAIGSNIANILLVIGFSALIIPISGASLRLRPQASFLLGFTFIFGCFSLGGTFIWYHGLVMAALLVAYLYKSFQREKPDAIEQTRLSDEISDNLGALKKVSESSALPIIFMVGGMALLLLGALCLIDGSVSVARKMGVSEAVIGLSLIAVGTSLPELATSLIAAVRGHMSLAVGNIVGSNIFNLFGVVGITSLISPVPVPVEVITIDLWVMGGATIVLCGLMLIGCAITRSAGAGLFMLYAVYMYHLWVR